MAHITVSRWGKNLAIRFPRDIASTAGIREGEQVGIETRGGEIVIPRLSPRFTLDELFRGHSPEAWRPNMPAIASRADGRDGARACAGGTAWANFGSLPMMA